jgi:hypothetical protein
MMRRAHAGVGVELEALPTAQEPGASPKSSKCTVQRGEPSVTAAFQLDEGRLAYGDEVGERPLAEAPPPAKCRDLFSKGWGGGQVFSAQGESQGGKRLIP